MARPRRGKAWDGHLLIPWEPNPSEVYLLALCAVSGGVGLVELWLVGQRPDEPALPVVAAWYLLLLLGGTTALVGAYWRNPIDGALIQRAAMWPVGAGAAMYSLALIQLGQLLAAGLVFVFGALCLLRARQLAQHAKAALVNMQLIPPGSRP